MITHTENKHLAKVNIIERTNHQMIEILKKVVCPAVLA